MTETVASKELLRLRRSSQLIEPAGGPAGGATGSSAGGIADVVHHLLALQAQDFGQALWALGLRCPGARRSDVLAALQSGEVIRSWPMRGTLHFVRPADLRWMLALTTPRLLTGTATRQRQLDLDRTTLERARELALEMLTGGGSASREEFLAMLNRAGIATTGQRGYHIIWYLAQTGTLCWGPPLETQQALVLLDEWAPGSWQPDRDEALRRFVLRYFTGHGPATLKDFVWWSKLTVADAKIGLALARPNLTELVHNDTSYWLGAAEWEPAGSAAAVSVVHALPGFDEYLLGYQDRSLPLPAEYAPRIVPGNNGVFQPTLVSRGRIVGTWRRRTTAAGVTVSAQPFTPLTGREAASLKRAAKAYAQFLELPLHGTVGIGVR